MSGQARRLGRLLAVRRVQEELDRSALMAATAAVVQVELALRRQEETVAQAKEAGRAALFAGERGDWLLADAQGEVAGWNRRGLEVLLAEREAKVGPARERFLESRLEREQVKLLMAAAEAEEHVVEERRAQAAMDDWVLARRARLVRIVKRS